MRFRALSPNYPSEPRGFYSNAPQGTAIHSVRGILSAVIVSISSKNGTLSALVCLSLFFSFSLSAACAQESGGLNGYVRSAPSNERKDEQDVSTPPVKNLSTTEPRVALALGGGGTRGAAHIGVLRVLKSEGIPIHCIAGTSMGAIVGGLYCAGQSPDEIQKRLLAHSFLRAYHTVPIPVRVAVIPLFLLPHLVGYHPYDGLYRGNRFANYMNHCVPEREREIKSLSPTFCAVATNLLDGKPFSITEGNLGKALQATAAIPALRRPVKIGDELLVDGGVGANLPAKQARALGADIVIAINVDETFPRAKDKEFRRIGSVSQRVLSMILAKVDEDQVASADLVIQPDVNGIHLLSTKKSDALRAIAAGEKAAREALPRIRKLLAENAMAQSP